MNSQTLQRCQLLLDNKDRVKQVYSWDGNLICLACASIFTARNQSVDPAALDTCKQQLKRRVSAFSSFRGNIQPAIASMMAASQDPARLLENGLQLYTDLKHASFWSSEYLVLAAMVIARLAEPSAFPRIISRTSALYGRMKQEHPILTSGKDASLCALMALSDRSDDQLLSDAEQCYDLLKPHFFSSDAVQALSHVLAICGGIPQENCQRTMALFDALKTAGRRYGTDYELPTLGVLALSGSAPEVVAQALIEVDDWLADQKGFGLLSGIGRKERLMFAGALTAQGDGQNAMETAAITSTVSMLIAQEAAICAAVAASCAASAAASSSS